MTLILNFANRKGALTVADRYVSDSTSGRTHYRNFNKVALVICRDAVVTVSFTGSAFVGKAPTDQALVSWIVGGPVSIDMNSFRKTPHPSKFYYLNQVVGNISKGLRAAREKSTSVKLEVIISGQRVYRSKIIPFLAETKKVGAPIIAGHRPLDYLTLAKKSFLHFSGGYQEAYLQLANHVRDDVAELDAKGEPLEKISTRLSEGIAEYSRELPASIGPNAQIIMSQFQFRKSSVRVELREKQKGDKIAGILGIAEGLPTPWVITPFHSIPPSRQFGNDSALQFSENYTVNFRPPKSEATGFYFGALRDRQ